ncbi:MAG TPA: response regulator [Rhodobacterales bacterium]|nr:response regulator [Rhodobacterales bacterium]
MKRALLVMGDELSRNIFEKRLAALGLTVTALAGPDDIDAATAAKVDVIIVDHKLREMGTAAFIAILRSLGATAPLVLISAAGASAETTGIDAVLTKPVSRPDFISTLSGLEPPQQGGAVPAASAMPDAPTHDALAETDEAAQSTAPEMAPEADPASLQPENTPASEPEPDEPAMPVFGSRRAVEAPPLQETPAPAAPEAEAPTPATPVFGTARTEPAASLPEASSPAPTPAQAAPVPAPVPQETAPDLAPEPEIEPTKTEASPAAPTPPEATPAPAPELRAMRVLAAEDNKTNQLVFSKLVKACDIALTFAGNGAEAVAAFERETPDLIFMDISMPGMDGKEATRRIREIEAERGLPPTRIVALTAHAMDGDADEIMAHGLDAHLTKPFKKPAILAEISATCPQEARPSVPELG